MTSFASAKVRSSENFAVMAIWVEVRVRSVGVDYEVWGMCGVCVWGVRLQLYK